MEKLFRSRQIINETDREMAVLFERRMKTVKDIAAYKKEKGLAVYDSSREVEVIANGLEVITDEEIRRMYPSFIRSTMDISKRYQQSVLHNGEEGINGYGYRVIPVSLGDDSYDIILGRGVLDRAGDFFAAHGKVMIVTDSGVPVNYVERVAAGFDNSFVFTVAQGEKNKSYDTYKAICEKLLENSFTRSDAVIAVGGGVVGDVAGFAAATYMRGIDFYNIPTTVLSQVDSSIGGKTAIDFAGVKNILGAFYQPKAVIIDPDVLSTLDERNIKNGLAESLKMSVCFSRELFELLSDESYVSYIERIIELSLMIKKQVVEADEREAGLRRSLNFGHTIGHGLELASDGELYHGECVALGMLPLCGENVKGELLSAMKNLGLPIEYKTDRERLRRAVSHDKKSADGRICVVRCDEIGSFRFAEMTVDEIMNLI